MTPGRPWHSSLFCLCSSTALSAPSKSFLRSLIFTPVGQEAGCAAWPLWLREAEVTLTFRWLQLHTYWAYYLKLSLLLKKTFKKSPVYKNESQRQFKFLRMSCKIVGQIKYFYLSTLGGDGIFFWTFFSFWIFYDVLIKNYNRRWSTFRSLISPVLWK